MEVSQNCAALPNKGKPYYNGLDLHCIITVAHKLILRLSLDVIIHCIGHLDECLEYLLKIFAKYLQLWRSILENFLMEGRYVIELDKISV